MTDYERKKIKDIRACVDHGLSLNAADYNSDDQAFSYANLAGRLDGVLKAISDHLDMIQKDDEVLA